MPNQETVNLLNYTMKPCVLSFLILIATFFSCSKKSNDVVPSTTQNPSGGTPTAAKYSYLFYLVKEQERSSNSSDLEGGTLQIIGRSGTEIGKGLSDKDGLLSIQTDSSGIFTVIVSKQGFPTYTIPNVSLKSSNGIPHTYFIYPYSSNQFVDFYADTTGYFSKIDSTANFRHVCKMSPSYETSKNDPTAPGVVVYYDTSANVSDQHYLYCSSTESLSIAGTPGYNYFTTNLKATTFAKGQKVYFIVYPDHWANVNPYGRYTDPITGKRVNIGHSQYPSKVYKMVWGF